MKTDLRYTPTSCFGYFALPELSSELTNISKIYHSNRMSVREKLKLNLRDSYQMFHNPNDPSREFQKLRNLHCELDLAVAKAYGWEDINLGHDFHKTTQGLRFTISEEARSEILQRLLMLNHASHEEEVKQGLHSNHKNSKKAQTKAVKQTTDPTQTTFLKNK
ncbi:MAG: hypothetical protein HQ517_10125 [SAR324 cluster bacterium]|nr:hypothetical protein [SAR324 cluster bacterium]